MTTKKPIDKLTIKGFKSIRDLDRFPLRRLNVLIGSNGSGKSNFVSYFRMLGELVEGRLQVWTKKQGGADRILTFGLKETSELESRVEFGSSGYRFVLEATADGGFTFTDETLIRDHGDVGRSETAFGGGQLESKLKARWEILSGEGVEDSLYTSLSSWKVSAAAWAGASGMGPRGPVREGLMGANR